jgi:nucleoside-diphosphate-sugar epimerase/predicted lipid carrier protein YhbT
LLRDLLASGQRVAVLVRAAPDRTASQRLAELLAFWSEALGKNLPQPVVLHGDLTAAGLGLGTAERGWLARQGWAVIHAAAQVSYQPTPGGEPWETNVNGTRRLLELCRALGLAEIHHLSTAFVCGDRRGIVREDELDCGRGFGNAYEQSKFAAEQLVRQFPGIRATVYRPSVVVGDSRTGYTSTYHHFYRFLELAVRLSGRPAGAAGESAGSPPRRQRLAIRLPLTGEETPNLVPVDWVSRALVELFRRPEWHGRTFHLVARQPVRLEEIKAIVQDLLPLEGIQWAGPAGLTDPTPLEQLILEQFHDYWSYLHSDLVFDSRNTRRALPDLPSPPFDRDLVARLLRFAQADGWGRGRAGRQPAATPDCAHYLEHVLPEQVRRSPLARALPRNLRFALDIQGPGGGQWCCCPGDGVLEVRRGLEGGVAVTYRTDAATFDGLVRGRETAQNAFFDRRIEIEGDMEKALKLAPLIERFLAELPEPLAHPTEALHAAAGR